MKNKMELKEIYQPISKELSQVETELKEQVNSVSENQKFVNPVHQRWAGVNEIISYFFNVPGKRLRPALVLLSAKSVSEHQKPITENLIHLATAVELIHNATLIHDDIVDNALHRREQPSLNKQFGNQIAVLAGDMLYARAFSLLTDELDKKIVRILSRCVEKMCRGEIDELRKPVSSFGEYLKIIENKTAGFMSACCQAGSMLGLQGVADLGLRQNAKQVSLLQEFGHNFGISYQIMDDYLDGDSAFTFKIDMLEKAKEYALRAKENIAFFNNSNSKYKESLENLSEYVVSRKHEQTESLSSI